WAFEARVGETSPIVEAKPAYYVFRLDSLVAEGLPPLADRRAQAVAAVKLEQQQAIAHRRADSLVVALRGTPNLIAAGAARGLSVQRFGPFTRLQPPSYLSRGAVVVGTAFGLRGAGGSGGDRW